MKTRFGSLGLAALGALALMLAGCPPKLSVPERPTGPAHIAVDSVGTFSTKALRPKNQVVSYRFDWNDGTMSAWTGLVPDDSAVSDTHTFSQTGTYYVRAKLRDAQNRESGWSEALMLVVGDVKWVYAFMEDDDSLDFMGNVAESKAGYLYAVSEQAALHIIRPDGTRRGVFRPPEEDDFTTSPMIGDSACYAASDTTVFGVLPNGIRQLMIPFRGQIFSGMAIGSDGNIYANCDNGYLQCRNAAGEVWSVHTAGGISSPVITADGEFVIVGGDNDSVQVLRTSDGSLVWAFQTGGPVASPAIGPDGTVYVGSDDGVLYAFKPEGGPPSWQYSAGEAITVQPVVAPDGAVFFASDDGTMHALEPSGAVPTVRWMKNLRAQVSTGALTADGLLFVKVFYGKQDGDSLLAFRTSDGVRVWGAELPVTSEMDILSSPLIGADGTVYVTSGSGVYAFFGNRGPPASGWAMFQHDAQRTGFAGHK